MFVHVRLSHLSVVLPFSQTTHDFLRTSYKPFSHTLRGVTGESVREGCKGEGVRGVSVRKGCEEWGLKGGCEDWT